LPLFTGFNSSITISHPEFALEVEVAVTLSNQQNGVNTISIGIFSLPGRLRMRKISTGGGLVGTLFPTLNMELVKLGNGEAGKDPASIRISFTVASLENPIQSYGDFTSRLGPPEATLRFDYWDVGLSGKAKLNVDPLPTSLSTQILPP
jgi:hypothetical protein